MASLRRWKFWLSCISLIVFLTGTLPAHSATFSVTNVNDSGAGSLRAAIALANAASDADTINFNISGTGVHTIVLQSQLSPITNPVTINGYSQPGSSANTLATSSNAVLQIELKSNTSPGYNGLVINGANCTVKGLAINSSFVGIVISGSGATGNHIEGCFIGTNAAGTTAAANAEGFNVLSGASGNTIGGTTPAARNIISGNAQSGIKISGESAAQCTGNVVAGNFIGLGKDGTTAIPNGGTGVYFDDWVKAGTVGGTTAGAGNVLSGNAQGGIYFNGANNSGNFAQGNYIGTTASGTVAKPNAAGIGLNGGCGPNTIGGTSAAARNVISGNTYEGITITEGAKATIQGNYIGTNATATAALPNSDGISISQSANCTIGGTTAGAGNVFSGNLGDGVAIRETTATANVVQGNFIGTNAAAANLGNGNRGIVIYNGAHGNTIGGTAAGAGNTIAFNTNAGIGIYYGGSTGNAVRGNSMYSNGLLGIDLAMPTDNYPYQITKNDVNDSDSGPNNGQNMPVLSGISVSGGVTTLSGALDSTPNTTFSIDIFGNATADVSGFGEGRFYLGSVTNVVTNATGHATFNFTVPAGAGGDGRSFSATATSAGGDTSEFSPAGIFALVTNTADKGGGSLSNAINIANFFPGTTIRFNIPKTDAGFNNGVFTIALATALPWITADGTIVDGATQKTFTPDANPLGPAVVVSGAALPVPTYSGGFIFIASHCILRGLVVNGFHDSEAVGFIGGNGGALLATDNRVEGCYVGTDAAGAARPAVANYGDIFIGDDGYTPGSGSTNNFIGGTTAAQRNVISGSTGYGIAIRGAATTGNRVTGNYLGLDRTGTSAISNENSIWLSDGAHGNLIGGTAASARNVFGAGGYGVRFSDSGTSNNTVAGNYIGTNASGTAIVGTPATGVYIGVQAQNNLIGGTLAGSGNLIASGYAAVEISGAANNNTVQGNYLGTNSTGALLGNQYGIRLSDAQNNLVGGTTAAAANVISGNSVNGVYMAGATSSGNSIQGNYIGLAPGGAAALPNGSGVAIVLAAHDNTIGGTLAGSANFISGNTAEGIGLYDANTNNNSVQGNTIGRSAGGLALGNNDGVIVDRGASSNVIGAASGTTGTSVAVAGNRIANSNRDGVRVDNAASIGNTIRGNSITANSGLGINLGPDNLNASTVNANDTGDADSGPNTLQNYPIITGVTTSGGNTTVSGTLNSKASTNFVIDLYTNITAEPGGFGEGATYLASQAVTTNSSGNATFSFSVAGTGGSKLFSATATNTTTGDTSEFGPQGAASVVINTLDSGPGSLRNALNVAAVVPGSTIRFNIPTTDGGFSNGVFTIRPASPLPTITANGTIIDGSSQTTFSGNTNTAGPEIALDGANAGTTANGLVLQASNCTVQNLAIIRFADGIHLQNSPTTGNFIKGCFIGIAADGITAAGNTGNGIYLGYGPQTNTIGGTTAAARNIISGNAGCGLMMDGAGTGNNLVQGNYIGTNAAGTSAVGNGNCGIGIRNAAITNTIGGAVAGARNIVSGNSGTGIQLENTTTIGNRVLGNYIGTNAVGTAALGNLSNGITSSAGVNSIGGVTAGEGNVIAFNRFYGIDVVGGSGLTIRGNQIYSNGLLGIDLLGGTETFYGGVTANDNLDADGGPNDLQNYPAISGFSSSGGNTTISGVLSSAANRDYVLDFYRVTRPDDTGFGEGEAYIGNKSVHTNASGQVTFSVSGAFTGQYFSATATDVLTGSTSEFSSTTVSVSITGFSPVSGPAGTAVTITGVNFTGATSVQFNGTASTFTVASSTSITTHVPAGATSGPITVTTPIGTATSAANFIVTPPPNDAFANAILLTGDSDRRFDYNRGATRQTGEPIHAAAGTTSVWYRWTPSKTGRAAFAVASSEFDTLLAVYTGTSLTNLQPVASNDDIGSSSNSSNSAVSFAATGGTQYYIAVDGAGGGQGQFGLSWLLAAGPPPNDNFANAQIIEGADGYTSGTNLLATKQTGEPNHAGSVGGVSVWYSWTAPISGRVDFSTDGSAVDTTLAVYTGNSLGALTQIAANDDSNGSSSRVTFNAVIGTTYRIAIDGYGGAQGALQLNWNTTVPREGSIVWTGAAGDGLWGTPGNWNLNRIPSPADSVLIDLAGTYTVTLNVDATVSSLTLGKSSHGSGAGIQTLLIGPRHTLITNDGRINPDGALSLAGGILQIDDALDVRGSFDWSGGTWQGLGHTYIDADGQLNIHGTAVKTLDYQSITNLGATNWNDSGNIVADNGSSILNQGDFNIKGDATLDWDGTGVKPRFLNDKGGTFTKLPTTGTTAATTTFKILFGNDGDVIVQAGIISLEGGGTSYGDFDIAALARINFASDYVFNKYSSNFTGDGFAGLINGTTGVDIDVTVSNLEFTNGELEGANDIQASNELLWSGGAMTGSGSTTMAAGSTMQIIGRGAKSLSQRKLNNNGTVNWDGTGGIQVANGATINNKGDFLCQTGSAFSLTGGAEMVFNNLAGGYLAGESLIAGSVINTGRVAPLRFAPIPGHPGIFRRDINNVGGLINITGDFTQSSSAQLDIQINGTTNPPSTQPLYGQLFVGRKLTLSNSKLNVALAGYAPKAGDTFEILRATSIVGDFAAPSYPPLAAGLAWSEAIVPTGTPAGTTTSYVLQVVALSPTLGGFTPGVGKAGQEVTINGTNLSTEATPKPVVKFNGVAADAAKITVVNAGQIKALVPVGATSGKITVETAGGVAQSATAFIIDNTAPATLTITAPASGATVGSLPAISGTVEDNANGSGMARVDIYLKRNSDGKWWTGTAWGTTVQTPFTSTLGNGAWTRNSGLPVTGTADTTKLLSDGTYAIEAWAYDNAGNIKTVASTFTVLTAPLSVAITTPADGSTIASLPAISGTAAGTGLSRVDLYLRRDSDGKWWTGTVWGTTAPTPFAATLNNGTWTRNSGLPLADTADSAKLLGSGSYAIGAWAYDGADNVKIASATFTVPAPASQLWKASDLSVGSDNLARLLWVRPDKAFALWTISAANAVSSTPLFGPIAGWNAPAIGIGGDLKMRVLLNNTDGRATAWAVQNPATGDITSTPAYGPFANLTCREIAAAPDNTTRLLWVRSDGAFAVWTVDGAGKFTSTPLFGPIAGWSASAVSAGGDGKTAILINNADGRAAVWTVQNTATGDITSTPAYGPVSGFTCRDLATGGDNKTRLLWVRSDGAFAVWTADAAGNFTSTPLYGPIAGWTGAKVAVGGDLKTRVLLTHTDGRAVVWTLDAGGNITSTPAFGPISTPNASPVRGAAPSRIIRSAPPALEKTSDSPIHLSSSSANAATGTIALAFTGQLDSATASDPARYIAAVDGTDTVIESAVLKNSETTVILGLRDGAMQTGQKVKVIYDLRDGKGRKLAGMVIITVR